MKKILLTLMLVLSVGTLKAQMDLGKSPSDIVQKSRQYFTDTTVITIIDSNGYKNTFYFSGPLCIRSVIFFKDNSDVEAMIQALQLVHRRTSKWTWHSKVNPVHFEIRTFKKGYCLIAELD